MKALNETKDYFSNQKNHGEEYSNCSIFMKNIPRTWNFDNIRSHFYSYGMIRDIVFGNTHNSNNGMATVVYSSPEEADRAIKDMNRRIINGVPISVTFEKNSKKLQGSERIQALAKVEAHKNEQTKRNNSLTVEITNLPTVTETDIRAVFGRDGSIRQVTINKDRYGRQTGVARIRFENSSGVENALKRSFQHVFGQTGPKIIVDRVTNTLPMKF